MLSSSPVLWPADFSDEVEDPSDSCTVTAMLGSHMRDCERSYIEAQLFAHDWNCSRTAISLGISRKNLWEKMRKLGIEGRHGPGTVTDPLSAGT